MPGLLYFFEPTNALSILSSENPTLLLDVVVRQCLAYPPEQVVARSCDAFALQVFFQWSLGPRCVGCGGRKGSQPQNGPRNCARSSVSHRTAIFGSVDGDWLPFFFFLMRPLALRAMTLVNSVIETIVAVIAAIAAVAAADVVIVY